MQSVPRVLVLALVAGLFGAGSAHAAFIGPSFTPAPHTKAVAGAGNTASTTIRWDPAVFLGGAVAPDHQDVVYTDMTAGGTQTAGAGAGNEVTLFLVDGHRYSITVSACESASLCTTLPPSQHGDSTAETIVDATPPSGAVQIDGGAAATNKREVTLSLTAGDPLINGIAGTSSDVDQYAVDVDNDGTFPCTFLILPGQTPDTSGCAGTFAPSVPATLTAGDGVKTVGVKFGDGARVPPVPCHPPFCFLLLSGEILGNASAAATDSIILDTAKPIALATQDRFSVEPGGTVRFDAGTSVDPSGTTPSGIDPAGATWDFKDGTPVAIGQSVSHSFSQVGTFVGELRVKDRAGNQSDPRQFSVTVIPSPSQTVAGGGTVGGLSGGTSAFKIDRVRLNARYLRSKLRGSIILSGTSTQSGPLRVDVRQRVDGKVRRLAGAVTAGAFETTLRLPADLLPGTYRLTIVGPSGTIDSSLRLIAPREGVLRSASLTASRRAAKATFAMASQPVGALRGRLTVSWRLGGKRLGLVTVRSGAKIGARLPAGATLARGRLSAQLRAGGVVVGDAVTRVR